MSIEGVERALWAAALVAGVAPLWASAQIPMVDLPQHLHLISVLHRLDDPTTLFPAVFEARGALTPYLGYYYVVSGLSWLLPLELANRLFLAAIVAGLPLSLAFLLRGLRRPAWPALLAVPFAYGDSFGWGFVNYLASLPLAVLTCGLFVRSVEASEARERLRWAAAMGTCLVMVLLFHVQAFAWLAVALPLLLVTSSAATGASWFRSRAPALVGVAPAVTLFVAWAGLRAGQPTEVAEGEPWRAWGPMLSPQNLGWKSFAQNRSELLRVLGNLLPDGADRLAVHGALGAAVAATLVAAATLLVPALRARWGVQDAPAEGRLARWRSAGLAALALVLFFALPFDIRGYMYYLNTRYAHLAAALAVAAVPPLRLPGRWRVLPVAVGTAIAIATAAPLWAGFRRFGDEAAHLERLALATGPRPRVMGLIYAPGATAVSHPVFLHAAAFLARKNGGLSNFSFASTPHSPLKYRGAPPPTFPSEWRADQFRWAEHGTAYDHFLVRGVDPARIFGARLGRELELAAASGDFVLLRRR